MKIRALPAALILTAALGCGSGERAHLDPTLVGPVPTEDAKAFARGANEFSLAFYKHVRVRKGNLCVSPHSARTCLAMVYAGARGRTAAQIKKALRFNLPQDKLHKAAQAAAVRHHCSDEKAGLFESFNGLWKREDRPFLPAYLSLVKERYGACIHDEDFGDPKAVADEINEWIEDRTRGRIKDLVSQGDVAGEAVVILVNAVYLKGDWSIPFEEDSTEPGPFHLSGGDHVEVPFMNLGDEHEYGKTDGVEVLEKSLGNGTISMFFILPQKRDGLGDVESRLTAETLDRWLGSVKSRTVVVTLPRFTVTTFVDLEPLLQTMGVVDMFSEGAANFGGMNDNKPCPVFFTKTVQKAFIQANEVGVEAAAATEACGCESEAPEEEPPVFRADHPFLFLIRHNQTGVILFLGRVANPLEE